MELSPGVRTPDGDGRSVEPHAREAAVFAPGASFG